MFVAPLGLRSLDVKKKKTNNDGHVPPVRTGTSRVQGRGAISIVAGANSPSIVVEMVVVKVVKVTITSHRDGKYTAGESEECMDRDVIREKRVTEVTVV